MTDKETLAVYDAKADEYAQLVKTEMTPDASLQAFLDQLPNDAQVLDLGCGPGRSAAMIAAFGHSVLATDASAEMVKLAKQQPGVTAQLADFEQISEVEVYDGVWANFSLLHAPRDAYPRYFKALSRALKQNGVFHIGMKTGFDSKRDGLGRLYTYVTQDELEALFRNAGLTPVSHRTGKEVGLDGVMAPWITMLARKHA